MIMHSSSLVPSWAVERSDGSRALPYVLSVPDWLDWITPFLPAYNSHSPLLCWPNGGKPPLRLVAAEGTGAILLSHHATLDRDASYAQGKSRILAQPAHVARIAHDKREMAELTRKIHGLLPIPDMNVEEATDHLSERKSAAVIVKDNGMHATVIQPAVEGLELSVNLITDGASCWTYAPVWKGRNNDFVTHPARRTRRFPAPIDPDLSARIMTLAARYAMAIGARGLLEVEFLVRDGEVFLVEVNPRLSATLRMCIAASRDNLLLKLQDIVHSPLGEDRRVAPTGCSVEVPLPVGASFRQLGLLLPLPGVSVSSRLTMSAPTMDEVAALSEKVDRILRSEPGEERPVRAAVLADGGPM
jgi:hypothetical protein